MLDKLGTFRDIIVFHLIVYVVTYLNFHCAFCEYFWFNLTFVAYPFICICKNYTFCNMQSYVYKIP